MLPTSMRRAVEASRAKRFLRVAKWVFVCWLLWVLYKQLYVPSSPSLWIDVTSVAFRDSRALYWLTAIFVLMPVNWLLEAQKWQQLLGGMGVSLRGRSLFKSVMAGISFSVVTPNRMGEYVGRVWVLPAAQRWSAGLSTLMGSLCAWLAFIGLGWPALWIWIARLNSWYEGWQVYLVAVVASLGPIGVWLLIGSWDRWRMKLRIPTVVRRKIPPFLSGYWQPLQRVRSIEGSYVQWAVLMAAARFGVYCLQYWLCLHFFGLELSLFWGLTGIAAIYLLQAALPLPNGAALLLRTEMAIWLWADQPGASAAILMATFSLFVINLGIPSLVGLFYIVQNEP
jgi:hypothetical protein